MDDQSVADQRELLKLASVTVHIFGTDTHPRMMFRDKQSRREVTDAELKRRLQNKP